MSAALLLGEQSIVADITANGSTVTFVSPSGVETEAKANIGSSEHEEGSIGGATASITIVKSHDFIIPVASIPAGFDVKTARGWKIQFGGGEYQPLSDGGQPPVVDSGRFGLMKRIHTKRVGDT